MRDPGQLIPDHAAILATLGRSSAAGAGQVRPGTVVRVTGTAQPGPRGALTAPFSGRPCVWFRALEITVNALADPNLVGLPPTLTSDMDYQGGATSDFESPDPFAVEDASGRVFVEPAHADIDAPTISHDERTSSYTGPTVLRREWILEAGAPVFAFGAVADAGARPALRATPSDCLVVSGRGEPAAVARSQTVLATLGGRRPGGTGGGSLGGAGIALAVAGAVVLVGVVVLLVVLLG